MYVWRIHTCQPTEFKNRETSKNLQGQPAEPCQQQRRASEGCGIRAISKPSVGGGGGVGLRRSTVISTFLYGSTKTKKTVISVQSFTKYSIFIVDVKKKREIYVPKRKSGR